mgnify:CR=1 FL=1
MFRIKLKELREKSGQSQYAFAKSFGVAQSTVGSWESGAREPNLETINAIAEYFNVSVSDLVDNSTTISKSLDEQLDGIEFALFGEVKDMTEAQKRDVLNFIKFLKSQEEK